MALDSATFLAQYPEFNDVDPTLIQTVITETDLMVAQDWKEKRETVIFLNVAHRLQQKHIQLASAAGMDVKTFGTGFESTVYGQQYLEMVNAEPFSLMASL